jgi:hypothetical protein
VVRRERKSVTPLGVADFSGTDPGMTWEEARQLVADGIPDGADTVEIVTPDDAVG